jgi:hypothetical protein
MMSIKKRFNQTAEPLNADFRGNAAVSARANLDAFASL